MIDKIKQYFALIAYVLGLITGGWCANLQYNLRLGELREAIVQQRAEAIQELSQKNSRIVDLQRELDDRHRVYSDSIADLTSRVQSAEDRARRAEKSSSKPNGSDTANCRKLLSRGAEVVKRCTQLLGDTSKQCDALIEFEK